MLLFIYYLLLSFCVTICDKKINTAVINVKRDPIDKTLMSVTGVALPILQWLSTSLNFTYVH